MTEHQVLVFYTCNMKLFHWLYDNEEPVKHLVPKNQTQSSGADTHRHRTQPVKTLAIPHINATEFAC